MESLFRERTTGNFQHHRRKKKKMTYEQYEYHHTQVEHGGFTQEQCKQKWKALTQGKEPVDHCGTVRGRAQMRTARCGARGVRAQARDSQRFDSRLGAREAQRFAIRCDSARDSVRFGSRGSAMHSDSTRCDSARDSRCPRLGPARLRPRSHRGGQGGHKRFRVDLSSEEESDSVKGDAIHYQAGERPKKKINEDDVEAALAGTATFGGSEDLPRAARSSASRWRTDSFSAGPASAFGEIGFC